MFTHLLRLVEGNDEGATAVEYAILAAAVGAVIAFTVWMLGQQVVGMFARVPLSVFGG